MVRYSHLSFGKSTLNTIWIGMTTQFFMRMYAVQGPRNTLTLTITKREIQSTFIDLSIELSTRITPQQIFNISSCDE